MYRYFKNLAVHLLDVASLKQQLLTIIVLNHKLNENQYGSSDCLRLAASSEHVDFVAHTTCQWNIITSWHERVIVTGRSQLAHGVQVCVIITLFTIFKHGNLSVGFFAQG